MQLSGIALCRDKLKSVHDCLLRRLTPDLYSYVHLRLARMGYGVPAKLNIRVLVDEISQRIAERVIFLLYLE